MPTAIEFNNISKQYRLGLDSTRTLSHDLNRWWQTAILHKEDLGEAVYDCPKTIVSREYSIEWEPGMEPYYPVNDVKNNELYLKYKALADQEENVVFGGRLAEYKYYDMALVIEQVMGMFDK